MWKPDNKSLERISDNSQKHRLAIWPGPKHGGAVIDWWRVLGESDATEAIQKLNDQWLNDEGCQATSLQFGL